LSEKKLILVGFGNVARAFVRLLEAKQEVLTSGYGFSTRITAIATGHHGLAFDPAGLDVEKALSLAENGSLISGLSVQPAPATILDLIRISGADVLLENSPVNHHSGQPAIDHLRAGLESGMHVITANKGPVAYAYRELTELAAQKGRKFYFESAVMDGAPIFSLFREPLPAVEVRGFFGILNSTTNILLELMEQGISFDQAVRRTQEMGLAETDPSADIDGWDSAIKVSALVNVIMGGALIPDKVDRTGIRGISRTMIEDAQKAGQCWKLVCSAKRENGQIVTKVVPEKISPGSPLYSINGASSYVQFETDILPGLGIVENDPSPMTTAYGLLADLINAVKND
jgi:homoserine dehydrogenase